MKNMPGTRSQTTKYLRHNFRFGCHSFFKGTINHFDVKYCMYCIVFEHMSIQGDEEIISAGIGATFVIKFYFDIFLK